MGETSDAGPRRQQGCGCVSGARGWLCSHAAGAGARGLVGAKGKGQGRRMGGLFCG